MSLHHVICVQQQAYIRRQQHQQLLAITHVVLWLKLQQLAQESSNDCCRCAEVCRVLK